MDHLKRLLEKYLESTLAFKKTHCKELIPITELNGVISLCRLYDSVTTTSRGVSPVQLIVKPVWTCFSRPYPSGQSLRHRKAGKGGGAVVRLQPNLVRLCLRGRGRTQEDGPLPARHGGHLSFQGLSIEHRVTNQTKAEL